MKYPSEMKQEMEEKLLEARVALYLKSSSIYEYKVERDVQNLLPKHQFDELIWWYVFKEKMLAFTFWTIAAFIAATAVWLVTSIGLSFSLVLILFVSIVVLPGIFFAFWMIFCRAADNFGNQKFAIEDICYSKVPFRELDQKCSIQN